jgi:hypothetical protein
MKPPYEAELDIIFKPQGQKISLFTRNTHVKYESLITNYSRDTANVKVFADSRKIGRRTDRLKILYKIHYIENKIILFFTGKWGIKISLNFIKKKQTTIKMTVASNS